MDFESRTPEYADDDSVARLPVRALRGLLGWLPLLACFALFAHLCLRGLAPARIERARLDSVEVRLADDHARLSATLEALEDHARAQDDPIYAERIQRIERKQMTGRSVAPPKAAAPTSPSDDIR